jgi:hypothetical protein
MTAEEEVAEEEAELRARWVAAIFGGPPSRHQVRATVSLLCEWHAGGSQFFAPRPRPRRRPQVYRRRRLVVATSALVLLSVSIAVLSAAGSALARTGGGPLTATGVQGSSAVLVGGGPSAGRTWVVRPGDTLWGIATALEPGRDVRPLVDRLEAELGTAALEPGQAVRIPAGA